VSPFGPTAPWGPATISDVTPADTIPEMAIAATSEMTSTDLDNVTIAIDFSPPFNLLG
jgi:hypothetical protein